MFSWDEIPGKDSERLLEFLIENFDVSWVKNARLDKIDSDKTIKVHTDKNSLSLKLNDERTEVILETGDGRTEKFIAKMEVDKLNIYEPNNRCQNINNLCKARAEIEELKSILESIRKGEVAHTEYKECIKRILKDLSDDINDITSENIDPGHLQKIKNTLEIIEYNPLLKDALEDRDSALKSDTQKQLKYIDMLDREIRKFLYLIGYITIPITIKKWLDNSSTGHYIPFHQVFDDDLTYKEDRDKLLKFLALQPKALEGGLIEPLTGLIRYYPKSRKQRAINIIGLVVAFLACTAIIYVLAPLLPAQSWTNAIQSTSWPENFKNIVLKPEFLAIILWISVWTGIIIHTALGKVKQRDDGGLPLIIPINYADKYINAKHGDILVKEMLAFLGFFGAIYAFQGTVNPLNAFLVGYSLDSFIEIFTVSIEQRALKLSKAEVSDTKDKGIKK